MKYIRKLSLLEDLMIGLGKLDKVLKTPIKVKIVGDLASSAIYSTEKVDIIMQEEIDAIDLEIKNIAEETGDLAEEWLNKDATFNLYFNILQIHNEKCFKKIETEFKNITVEMCTPEFALPAMAIREVHDPFVYPDMLEAIKTLKINSPEDLITIVKQLGLDSHCEWKIFAVIENVKKLLPQEIIEEINLEYKEVLDKLYPVK